MNRRVPYACGQSGRLVRPAGGHVTWSGVDLQEAARRALAPASTEVPISNAVPDEQPGNEVHR